MTPGHSKESRGTRVALLLSTYVVPAVGTPLAIWLWASTAGWRMAVVAFGAATVFGYVMPAIGTAVLHKWRFHGPGRLGSLYAHHGFIYASKMALVLWIAMPRPADLTVGPALAAVALAAAAIALGGWWHDLVAVRAGRIELLAGLAPRGGSVADAVAGYAPPSFFVMGLTYAGTCWVAALWLARDPDALPWAFLSVLVALCTLPAAVLLMIERRGRLGNTSRDGSAIPEAGA
jgi:hypothetical protein